LYRVPYRVKSTQYTVHSTGYTVRRTEYTVHSSQYRVHSAKRTVHSTQNTVHRTQNTEYLRHIYTQYTACSRYTVHSTYICDTYVGEAELVAEPGALLLLLLGLELAQRVLVGRVLVHVALVPLLLTQPEVVSYTKRAVSSFKHKGNLK